MGIRECKIFPSQATTFHDEKKGQAVFFILGCSFFTTHFRPKDPTFRTTRETNFSRMDIIGSG